MATLIGTSANDTLIGGPDADTLDGGPGGADSLSGGAGNDHFISGIGADAMTGGEGNDTFALLHAAAIIGGEGRDTYVFGSGQFSISTTPARYDLGAAVHIADFTPGVEGDIVDLRSYSTSSARVWWGTYEQRASNPFESGSMRLDDFAGGARLQIMDIDGWKTMAVFSVVSASQFTADNFADAINQTSVRDEMSGAIIGSTSQIVRTDPRASPVVDGSIDGTAGVDTISGATGDDFMRGLDGNDSVFGGHGDDDINGNVGADIVDGGTGDDWVRGGRDNDTIYGGLGNDLHVNGNIGDDAVYGGQGHDFVFGGQDNDTLYGDDDAFQGQGNDSLSGDLGNDILYGGFGIDNYAFRPGGGRDWIMDFQGAAGERITLPVGTTYTIRDYFDQVIIELSDGSGLGLQHRPVSLFPADWIVFI